MKNRGRIIFLIIVICGPFLFFNKETNYKIPGIVRGTAKIVQTDYYLGNGKLTTAKAKVKLITNNTQQLEISIGYKPPSDPLMVVNNPIKETVLWLGHDLFCHSSENVNLFENYEERVSIKNNSNSITREWDLFSLGFDSEDYVKADERIWYLRILFSGNAINEDQMILDTFELTFNELRFTTLLHPYFDGTKPVIIPIRGVNHELRTYDVTSKTANNEKPMNAKDTTGTLPGSNPNAWCAVFATSKYDSDDDDKPMMDDEAAAFIYGSSDPDLPNGMYYFGWNIAYCMDGDTIFATVSKTKPRHFRNLLDYVDGQLGPNDKCIIFVDTHGIVHDGEYYFVVGNSFYTYWFDKWYNVIDWSEIHDWTIRICKDDTNDNTYVFFWALPCHSWNLGVYFEWQNEDNNHLQIWTFKPQSLIEAEGKFGDDLHWYYEAGVQGMFHCFFSYLENGWAVLSWLDDACENAYEAMCAALGHGSFEMMRFDWFPISYIFMLIVL